MTEYIALDQGLAAEDLPDLARTPLRFRPSSAHGWVWSGVADAFSTVSATGPRYRRGHRPPPRVQPARTGRRGRPTKAVEAVHADQATVDRRRAVTVSQTLIPPSLSTRARGRRWSRIAAQHRTQGGHPRPARARRAEDQPASRRSRDTAQTRPAGPAIVCGGGDRLTADHVQRVTVHHPLDEVAQVAAPVRTPRPVQARDRRRPPATADRPPPAGGARSGAHREDQQQPEHRRGQRDHATEVGAHRRPALADHDAEADHGDRHDGCHPRPAAGAEAT